MGTRYEDQPTEHWAGAESLDPTPVWKQYALVALLLVVGLIVVVIVAMTALAPTFATPPALVIGDRLVLAAHDVPAVGAIPLLVTAPLVNAERAFLLAQPQKGVVVALRADWRPHAGDASCLVGPVRDGQGVHLTAFCDDPKSATTFNLYGEPTAGAPRAIDQYLVSVSGDRVIVNLSRVIEASERTKAPVPTGIPQPQQP